MTADSFADVVEAHRIPTIVRLADNLYALVYRLMKLVPARHILRRAREKGLLDRDVTVVETTSGTFGLALAMECAIQELPLILVSDPVMDVRLQRQLRDLGSTIDIVHEYSPNGGYQATRLARVAEIQAELAATYCPEQYSNPGNPESYAFVADLVSEGLGQIDCVVGPVGSGGSMCGTARHLRAANADLTCVGIDTHGSVLFGQQDAKRALRGLGNSLLPPNLEHEVFDEVHWLDAPGTFQATRRLHREHALFMGPTSGASYLVGSWWAGRHRDALTLIVLPDEGYRYHDTVYDDDWMAANASQSGARRHEPRTVVAPREADDGWCRIAWGRRSLRSVALDRDLAASSS
jgi:cysteine synthase